MNIYSDTPVSGPISFAIHWDTTKLDDAGQPDPAYVEWYTFGPKPATDPRTRAQYANACKEEARLLARLVRQERNRAARRAKDLGVPETDNS